MNVLNFFQKVLSVSLFCFLILTSDSLGTIHKEEDEGRISNIGTSSDPFPKTKNLLLPKEIIHEVFEFLDLKNIWVCSGVSKYFLDAATFAPYQRHEEILTDNQSEKVLSGFIRMERLIFNFTIGPQSPSAPLLPQATWVKSFWFKNGLPDLSSFTNLVNLEKLSFSGNPIGDNGALRIGQIPCSITLRELNLSNSHITSVGIKALASSLLLNNLTALYLSDNNLADKDISMIALSPNFKNLAFLNLSLNNITCAGAKVIAESQIFSNLTNLCLWSNTIKAEGAKAIAASKNLTNLKSLTLKRNSIGINGTQEIFKSHTLVNLTYLDLDFNNIMGFHLITKEPHLQKLKVLCLSNNKIDDEDDSRAISEIKTLPNLTLLKLQNTNIRENGLKLILNNPYFSELKKVDIKNRHFSKTTQTTLKEISGDRVIL